MIQQCTTHVPHLLMLTSYSSLQLMLRFFDHFKKCIIILKCKWLFGIIKYSCSFLLNLHLDFLQACFPATSTDFTTLHSNPSNNVLQLLTRFISVSLVLCLVALVTACLCLFALCCSQPPYLVNYFREEKYRPPEIREETEEEEAPPK